MTDWYAISNACLLIVGCGRHMKQTIAPIICRIPGFSVKACVDLDIERAQRIQKLLRATYLSDTVDPVIINDVDGAIIALPPDSSFNICKYLIGNRIPIFVEKPPASSTSDINTLAQLSQDYDTPVQVGFNFRCAPAFKMLKSSLGTQPIASATMEFLSRHPNGPEWGVTDPVEAFLRHNGVHCFDLIQYLCGPVTEVFSHVVMGTGYQFLLHIQLVHYSGSVSTIVLGNLTYSFTLRATVTLRDGTRFHIPNIGHLTQESSIITDIYTAPTIDRDMSVSGHGTELYEFGMHTLLRIPSDAATLMDAANASHLCDIVLSQL